MKVDTVRRYLNEISSFLETSPDSNTLDRVSSLLHTATATIKSATTPTPDLPKLTVKDHFEPAQKNQTQLRFKKVSAPTKRKKPVLK